MDGSTVHFPARAPQNFRVSFVVDPGESGGSLALCRDGRGGLVPLSNNKLLDFNRSFRVERGTSLLKIHILVGHSTLEGARLTVLLS